MVASPADSNLFRCGRRLRWRGFGLVAGRSPSGSAAAELVWPGQGLVAASFGGGWRCRRPQRPGCGDTSGPQTPSGPTWKCPPSSISGGGDPDFACSAVLTVDSVDASAAACVVLTARPRTSESRRGCESGLTCGDGVITDNRPCGGDNLLESRRVCRFGQFVGRGRSHSVSSDMGVAAGDRWGRRCHPYDVGPLPMRLWLAAPFSRSAFARPESRRRGPPRASRGDGSCGLVMMSSPRETTGVALPRMFGALLGRFVC